MRRLHEVNGKDASEHCDKTRNISRFLDQEVLFFGIILYPFHKPSPPDRISRPNRIGAYRIVRLRVKAGIALICAVGFRYLGREVRYIRLLSFWNKLGVAQGLLIRVPRSLPGGQAKGALQD